MQSFNAKVGSLSLVALAVCLGVAPGARADFPVICPRPVAFWGGDAAGISKGILTRMTSVEPPLDDSRLLACSYAAEVGVVSEVRVPNDGTCSGSAQLIGQSAVFGRSEVFESVVVDAVARTEGDECVLQIIAPVSAALTMSQDCSSNDDGLSWDCPDDAFQVSSLEP